MSTELAISYAKTLGYTNVEYLGRWKDYSVYKLLRKDSIYSSGALQKFLLVDSSDVRLASLQESIEIIVAFTAT